MQCAVSKRKAGSSAWEADLRDQAQSEQSQRASSDLGDTLHLTVSRSFPEPHAVGAHMDRDDGKWLMVAARGIGRVPYGPFCIVSHEIGPMQAGSHGSEQPDGRRAARHRGVRA